MINRFKNFLLLQLSWQIHQSPGCVYIAKVCNTNAVSQMTLLKVTAHHSLLLKEGRKRGGGGEVILFTHHFSALTYSCSNTSEGLQRTGV